MFNKFILLCLALIFVNGCENSQEPALAPEKSSQPLVLATSPLMTQPVDTILVETPNELLTTWRTYAAAKPTLLLFSSNPFLKPVPSELLDQAMDLAQNGTPAQVRKRAVDNTSDPLLLHGMAVDVALRSGFFAEVAWILPIKDNQEFPTLTAMQETLRASGQFTPEEIDSLHQQDQTLIGTFRNTPYTISDLNTLPEAQGPVWVHFDLNFFKPLYKNEVSTPLFKQVVAVLGQIQNAKIESHGASVSLSNLSGNIALDVRFLGNDIKQILSDQKNTDNKLTQVQVLRSQNLYLKEFFKKDEILQNLITMEKLAPDNASIQFDLYKLKREMKQGDEALAALNMAVALDPVYAIEYMRLAGTAMKKDRPDAALQMLDRAKAVFPNNPSISLLNADILIRLGRQDEAIVLIEKLKNLQWSEVYDKGMPDKLIRMEKFARVKK